MKLIVHVNLLHWLQIFPIHIKGIAGSLVVLVNWLGAWAVSYTFNFLMSWSSTGSKESKPDAHISCTCVAEIYGHYVFLHQYQMF